MTIQNPDRKYVDDWRKAVLSDPTVNAGQARAAMAYSFHFNYDPTNSRYRTAWAAAETVAAEAGMKPETAEKALRALRKAGYLANVGRTSGTFGANINRFTFPKSDTDAAKQGPDTPHENAGSPARESGHPPHENADNSLKDSLTDSLNLPLSADSAEDEQLTPLAQFLEDEPNRRAEYINYLIKTGAPYSYAHIIVIFKEVMGDATRSNWPSTFKAFIAKLSGSGSDWDEFYDDLLDYGVERVESTRLKHADHFTHEDFPRTWHGHCTNVAPDEYRRAWEHALVTYTGTTILAVAASQHVNAKYPREFAAILAGLSQAQITQAKAQHLNTIPETTTA